MSWNLRVTGPARKALQRVPARDQVRLKAALTAIQHDPFSGDIAHLTAQPGAWRRRVGSYRIFFDVYPK